MNFSIKSVKKRAPALHEMFGPVANMYDDLLDFEIGRDIFGGKVEVTMRERWRSQFSMSLWAPVELLLPIPEETLTAYFMLMPMGETLIDAFPPYAANGAPELIINKYFRQSPLWYDHDDVIYVNGNGQVNKSRRWICELPDPEKDLKAWTYRLKEELEKTGRHNSARALNMYLEG